MSDESRTVGGAYAKITAHEDLCAERYDRINTTLEDLKEGQKAHSKAAWGIVLALLGWMGVQVWNGSPHVAQAATPAVAPK
jgi:hypothetical protein